MPAQQEGLLFDLFHNQGLFSNHWLAQRLPMEPEMHELRDSASDAIEEIVDLWKVQRTRVERYGDEQGLEEGFIQPVLRSLGWKLKYQAFLQGREPDYALFLDDAGLDRALDAGRNSPEFWAHPAALADAKAWHVSLDRRGSGANRREYPPEQIEWYLDRSRLDFAILTNGHQWRLIPREYGPQQRRFQTYLEFDLRDMLERLRANPTIDERSDLADDFLRFFLFFGPTAFRVTDDRQPLIRRALEGSSEYRLGVGEGLKEQTFEALRLCIEGFLNFKANELHPNFDLEHCRDQSSFCSTVCSSSCSRRTAGYCLIR